MLDMSLPTLQLVKLHPKSVEDASDASMVGEHHAAHLVRGSYVWALLRQRHLDRGWAPRNEVC